MVSFSDSTHITLDHITVHIFAHYFGFEDEIPKRSEDPSWFYDLLTSKEYRFISQDEAHDLLSNAGSLPSKEASWFLGVNPLDPVPEAYAIVEELALKGDPTQELDAAIFLILTNGEVEDYKTLYELTAAVKLLMKSKVMHKILPYLGGRDSLIRSLVETGREDLLDYAIEQGHIEPRHINLLHSIKYWDKFFSNPKLTPGNDILSLLIRDITDLQEEEIDQEQVRYLLERTFADNDNYGSLVGVVLTKKETLTEGEFVDFVEEHKVRSEQIKDVMTSLATKRVLTSSTIKEALSLSESWGEYVLRRLIFLVGSLKYGRVPTKDFNRYLVNSKNILEGFKEAGILLNLKRLRHTLFSSVTSKPYYKEGKSKARKVLNKFADLFMG